MNAPPHTHAAEHRRRHTIGRLAASATHELANVLAIIEQADGLLADRIALAEENEDGRDLQLMTRVHDRIERQVARGSTLVTALNRLAHTVDEEPAHTDLAQILELHRLLFARFAALARVDFEVTPPAATVFVPLRPDEVITALYDICRDALDHTEPGESLRLDIHLDADTVTVWFRGEGAARVVNASGTESIDPAWMASDGTQRIVTDDGALGLRWQARILPNEL